MQLQRAFTSSGEKVDLIVEDNGPGIPEEERERVFERFYRLIDRDVSGSGLGLAIVREIALMHEAEVSLEDGPGGIGARVQVRFKPAKATVKPGSSGTPDIHQLAASRRS